MPVTILSLWPEAVMWNDGRPPEMSGLYLIQYQNNDYEVAEVYREHYILEEGTYWTLKTNGSTYELLSDHIEVKQIKRHFGPILRPEF